MKAREVESVQSDAASPRPAVRSRKTQMLTLAEREVLENLRKHDAEVIRYLEEAFGCSASLPLIRDAIENSGLWHLIAGFLLDYGHEEEGPLDQLPPEIADVLREPPRTPRTVLQCKAQFFLAAMHGWVAHAHLVAGSIGSAVCCYGFGREALGRAKGLADVLWGNQLISDVAKRGAAAKLLNDPRQHDKKLVKDCWDAWQKAPHRYKGKAEFARDMLLKFETLKSQPVIERWCREWALKARTLPVE